MLGVSNTLPHQIFVIAWSGMQWNDKATSLMERSGVISRQYKQAQLHVYRFNVRLLCHSAALRSAQ